MKRSDRQRLRDVNRRLNAVPMLLVALPASYLFMNRRGKLRRNCLATLSMVLNFTCARCQHDHLELGDVPCACGCDRFVPS